MKKNKLLKSLAFGFLAVLVGVFAFVPKKSINNTHAYKELLTRPTEFNTTMPVSTLSSHELYSGFLHYATDVTDKTNVSNQEFSIGIAGLVLDTQILTMLDFSAITPSGSFNAIDFIKSYLAFYQNITLQDLNRSIYLILTPVFNSSSGNIDNLFNDLKLNLYANQGNSSNPIVINGYDYSDNSNNMTFFTRAGNIALNLSYICDTQNIDLYTLLTTYLLEFTFNSTLTNVNIDDFLITLSMEVNPSARLYYLKYNYLSNNSIDYLNGNFSTGSSSTDLGNTYYFIEINNGTYYDDYYNKIYQDKLDKAEQDSYNRGYNLGYSKGSEDQSELPATIISFASLPFSVLGGFLDFNLFGFNVYSLVLSICTLLICVWVIRKII